MERFKDQVQAIYKQILKVHCIMKSFIISWDFLKFEINSNSQQTKNCTFCTAYKKIIPTTNFILAIFDNSCSS